MSSLKSSKSGLLCAQAISRLMALALIFAFFLVSGCDKGSSSRSTASKATSGDYEILVTITQPANNSSFRVGDSFEFVAVATGGTGTYGWTWRMEGGGHPSRSYTGETATITFPHTGKYKVTVIVTDSNGITGKDSVNITIGS